MAGIEGARAAWKVKELLEGIGVGGGTLLCRTRRGPGSSRQMGGPTTACQHSALLDQQAQTVRT